MPTIRRGSQAGHFWSRGGTQDPWDQVKNLASFYVEPMEKTTRDYVAKFESTAFAKMLNLKLLDNWDTLNTTVTKVREQLGPVTQDFWKTLEKNTRELRKKLREKLDRVKTEMKPQLEKFQEDWQSTVRDFRMKVEGLGPELSNGSSEGLQKLANFTRQRLRLHAQSLHQEVGKLGDSLSRELALALKELNTGNSGPGGLPAKANQWLSWLSELRLHTSQQLQQLQGLGPDQALTWEEVVAIVWGVLEEATKTLTTQ
ncbi:PREDICTED: apolipoprotein A-I [Miniopterus natalensis]|uniref:apolipoprotein A-I n=1 Tax=Miniopterus natalensis TaxID=291302 RepID=UPI0007A6F019|nr:PREDICTED: apolipoprotein A-I [Miniopterus natalensis]